VSDEFDWLEPADDPTSFFGRHLTCKRCGRQPWNGGDLRHWVLSTWRQVLTLRYMRRSIAPAVGWCGRLRIPLRRRCNPLLRLWTGLSQ